MTPTLVTVPEDGNADNMLAARYRAAFDKTKAGREMRIEGTLELAVVIQQARRQYPHHREYSQWLKRNDLQELTAQDRWLSFILPKIR